MTDLRNPGILAGLVAALALLLCLVQPVRAGMVGTDEVLQGTADQRAEVMQALEREAVAAELRAMGVSPADAHERVQRMTDAEIAQLHQRVAALPAGGDLSTVEILLIIIIVILIV